MLIEFAWKASVVILIAIFALWLDRMGGRE